MGRCRGRRRGLPHVSRSRQRTVVSGGSLRLAKTLATMYIELHASSAFSFLDGASLPEALIDRAAALGYPALALLDRDGVYGAPRFHLAASRAGIKAIVGAELTMAMATGTAVFRLPILIESRE